MLNEKVNKINNRKFWLLFIIAGVLLIFSSKYDYQISKIMVNHESIIANISEHYTVQGAAVVYFCCFEILTWTCWVKITDIKLRLVTVAGLFLLDVNQMFAIMYDFVYYTAAVLRKHNQHFSWHQSFDTATLYDNSHEVLFWFLTILFTVVLSFVFFYVITNKSADELDYSIKAALFGIAVVTVVLLSIDSLKSVWGRVRPKDVFVGNGTFTPWYKINGVNGNSSFPSGHVRWSWMYLYLPSLLKTTSIKLRSRLTAITIFIGVLAAYSRVKLGAHWVSDVTVSSLISVFTILVANRLLKLMTNAKRNNYFN